MEIVSLINDAQIIDRGQLVIELLLDDPMPDYDCEISLLVQTVIEHAEAAMTNAI